MPSRASAALTPAFEEKTVILRNIPFTLRELSIGEYDELVTKATTTQTNALGETTENVDNTVLLKLMVRKSLVSPNLTPAQLAALPTKVQFKLNSIVNQMHYGDEPEGKPAEGTEEESDPGNG